MRSSPHFFANPRHAAIAVDGIVTRPCGKCSDCRKPAPSKPMAAPRGVGPRVGMVSPSWTVGGVERWFLSLCRLCVGISFAGVAVTEEPGSALVDEDLVREAEAFCPVTLGAGAVDRLLESVDVVIVWGTDRPEAFDRFREKGGRVVFVSHGMGEWTRRKADAWAPVADVLAAVSRSALLPFAEPVRDRVRVVHNGIEFDRIAATRSRSAIREAWGLKPGSLAIGYCGRYSEEKNPEAAALAASKIKKSTAVYQCPPFSRQFARNVVESIVPGRCVFPGGPVSDFYGGIDVMVAASKQEGFALAITEAWAAGVPVVATDVGAVSEMEALHGELVVRVEHGADPMALSMAVKIAASEGRRPMVERARSLAWSHFGAGRMAREWSDLFRSLA